MKKKLFSMMLVAALATSLLAGCNSKNKKADTTETPSTTVQSTESVNTKTVSTDGIKITGSMNAAEKVEMSSVTDGEDYQAATDFIATLEKNITATEVCNINLLDKDSKKVQPDSSVKINLTLSDNMVNAEGDGYEVYRMEDDKSFTKLTASVKDKEISFDTEHFSIYVLVKTSSDVIAVGEPDSEAADNGEADKAKIEAAESNPSAFTFTSKNTTMYTTSSVNVRTGPDSYFEKIASLPKGQAVTVLAQCNETGWYQVDIGDSVVAFVSNNYLSTEQPTQSSTSSTSNNNSSNNNVASNDNKQEPAQQPQQPQQPEQTEPAAPEPTTPAPANNCPYQLLTVTTYQGYTGFFYSKSQRGTTEFFEACRQAQIAAGGSTNKSITVGTYDDTGKVFFQCVWK